MFAVCRVWRFYLEGPKAKFNKDPGLCARVFWQEGKHHIVHPKQWDKKESRFGQPPAHIVEKSLEEYVQSRVYLVVRPVCVCVIVQLSIHSHLK